MYCSDRLSEIMSFEGHSLKIATRKLVMDDSGVTSLLVGPGCEHMSLLEKTSEVTISVRGTELLLKGDEHRVALVAQTIEELYGLARAGRPLYGTDFEQAFRLKTEDSSVKLSEVFMDKVFVSSAKRVVTPQGIGQKKYIDAIREHDVVFGIGPAGTGKTYLAVAMAVAALQDRSVKKIVISRPAVEAGERLGFLPGDLAEKVNPYLRPLYDALHDMMDLEKVDRLIEKGTIEIVPLAFMRGRTLNDSFIILDEAQNTTSDQMKMFLTRLGYESKAVITGDITQVDLSSEKVSGLIEARSILASIDGISFCEFSEADVVRHPLVRDVIRAYERAKGGKLHG